LVLHLLLRKKEPFFYIHAYSQTDLDKVFKPKENHIIQNVTL